MNNFSQITKLDVLNTFETAVELPEEVDEREVLEAALIARMNLEYAIESQKDKTHIRDAMITKELNVIKKCIVNDQNLFVSMCGEYYEYLTYRFSHVYGWDEQFVLKDYREIYRMIHVFWNVLPNKKSLYRLLLFMSVDTPWCMNDSQEVASDYNDDEHVVMPFE